MSLFRLDASIRTEGSHSRQIADIVQQEWRASTCGVEEAGKLETLYQGDLVPSATRQLFDVCNHSNLRSDNPDCQVIVDHRLAIASAGDPRQLACQRSIQMWCDAPVRLPRRFV